MNKSTIWYSIDSDDHPQCDIALVITRCATGDAEKVAADFAAELQFITKLDPEQIKVWVE
jgi:hypothetical protein